MRVQTITQPINIMKRLLSALYSISASMRSVSVKTLLCIRQRHSRISPAMTLVELMIVVAMVGTLTAIGVPAYNNYKDKVNNHQAIEDIRFIEAAIKMFHTENGGFPQNLAQVRSAGLLDPWGNPYRYLRILPPTPPLGQRRKEHGMVPVNFDFDLYSMGKDGRSAPPFTSALSRDDIVRANDGAYVGLALDY